MGYRGSLAAHCRAINGCHYYLLDLVESDNRWFPNGSGDAIRGRYARYAGNGDWGEAQDTGYRDGRGPGRLYESPGGYAVA
jgi:hypothetical protein